MIYKYACKVVPNLEDKRFDILTPRYLTQRASTIHWLSKLFYFYHNPIRERIVFWKYANKPFIHLEPGTNRYLGAALRNSNTPIDAVLITDDEDPKDIANVSNIIRLDKFDPFIPMIKNGNFLSIGISKMSRENPLHHWAIPYSQLNHDWYEEAFFWVNSHIDKVYCLSYNDIQYCLGDTYRLSGYRTRKKEVIDCSNQPSLLLAVRDFFEKIPVLT